MNFEGESHADDSSDSYNEETDDSSDSCRKEMIAEYLAHRRLFNDDDGYDPGYRRLDEAETLREEFFCVGIVRIPLTILQSTVALLQKYGTLPLAWMLAIGEKFPNTPLRKLRSRDPSLLPPWLLQGFATYQDMLVLRHVGIFARSLAAHSKHCKYCKVNFKPLSILAATSKCRFREGYTSEGMLCNNPPIPLRVLDFLEHTEDLLNLAVVCKATHQAAHVLLDREFPSGVGPGLLTEDDLVEAINRRKRSMLESALRQPHHPITSSMASTSTTMAAGTEPEACAGPSSPQPLWKRRRTQAEACTSSGTEAEACAGAGTEAEGCAVDNAEEADHVYEKMFTIVQGDERQWDVLDWCMLTLLHANKLHVAGPLAPVLEQKLLHPSLELLLRDGGVADEWRLALENGLEAAIVMDTEAVRRAIAYWADLNIEDSDRSSGRAATDAEHVMRVLCAAERHGQGVIVHRASFLDFDRYEGFIDPLAG